MADRLRITEAVIANQIEAHHYKGDDGYPTASVFSPVGVTTEDGRDFFFPMGKKVVDEEGYVFYAPRYDAVTFRAKVEAEGSIDPDLWIEVLPIDLEAEFGWQAAWREREEDRWAH
jgi:hypothetical protein